LARLVEISKEFLALSGLQFLAIVYFLLLFYEQATATQTFSTFMASVIFGFIAIGSLVLNFWLFTRDIPLHAFDPMDYTSAFPYMIAGVVGIWLVAQYTMSMGGGSVVFSWAGLIANVNLLGLPGAGSGYLPGPLAATGPALNGFFEVVAWNFVVASSEEGFKVGLTNVFAMPLEKYFGETSVWLSAAGVIFAWTWLHRLNAMQSSSALIMAYVAGFFLLALTIKFQNFLPAVVTHLAWNLLASFG